MRWSIPILADGRNAGIELMRFYTKNYFFEEALHSSAISTVDFENCATFAEKHFEIIAIFCVKYFEIIDKCNIFTLVLYAIIKSDDFQTEQRFAPY